MREVVTPAAAALQKYFGFSSFRPLQEEIINDVLAGGDVLALLPTGGGKSLCFQLPALLKPGLTVVVSPLIALMKDQVDSLTAAGVAATFLNSSLEPEESRRRLRGLHQGEYKLLYVAPERLLLSGFLEDLERWNLGLFAIDEAHCISEWGHDFRPDYRQLAQLRPRFPGVPILALTATATERVRQDILSQLRLRTPKPYVASFNRPNLSYKVVPKQTGYDQLIDFVRRRSRESGIVYCQSRKRAETLAAALKSAGVSSGTYHAGMESKDRALLQEKFLRDEVRVMCATIAFGMGINKPNVRFVVHFDLPKNLEGYYQETGRAGRDGLPGECLLLFSPGDIVKSERFIAMKDDPAEQEKARAQLRIMAEYAESPECRRQTLLAYFGESSPGSCGSCDNCNTPREKWDATIPAQKLLSCVYRIQEKSGFSMGLNHITQVLTGADNQRIRDLGHDQLSTYGLGKELDKAGWAGLGRELIRLGLLAQDPGRFNTVDLTPAGRDHLRKRTALTLSRIPRDERERPVTPSPGRYTGGSGSRDAGIACDEVLFESLRALRKRLADERDVPAYIILSDVALRQMARTYPVTAEQLIEISGVGEKKLRDFGDALVAVIKAHLMENPRVQFGEEGSGFRSQARGPGGR